MICCHQQAPKHNSKQLQAAIGNLIELNNPFDEVIGHLESRLQSVLRPKQEMVNKLCDDKMEVWVQSADQIRGFTFILKNYLNLLQDIADRTEA
jgi:hypothetical protein